MVRLRNGNPRSTELKMIEEDSYRMWEINKQMSPSQPLVDLTTPAFKHSRKYDPARPSRKVVCQRFADEPR